MPQTPALHHVCHPSGGFRAIPLLYARACKMKGNICPEKDEEPRRRRACADPERNLFLFEKVNAAPKRCAEACRVRQVRIPKGALETTVLENGNHARDIRVDSCAGQRHDVVPRSRLNLTSSSRRLYRYGNVRNAQTQPRMNLVAAWNPPTDKIPKG